MKSVGWLEGGFYRREEEFQEIIERRVVKDETKSHVLDELQYFIFVYCFYDPAYLVCLSSLVITLASSLSSRMNLTKRG